MALFSKAKAFLILLAAVIFAASASILGLTAHGIAFYIDATVVRYDYVKVTVPVWNQTDSAGDGNSTIYTTSMAYKPSSGLDMSDMYALLMAGILGTLLGFFILITNVWTVDCKVNVSLTGRTVRPVNLLGSTAALVFEACLLITFIATAGYSWTAASESFQYLDTTEISNPSDNFTWYDGSEFFSFEYWNCALASVAALSAGTGPYSGPSGPKLYELCKQARTARILGLVLFVLAVVRLAAHYWVWRRHNIAVRLAKAQEFREEGARAKEASSHGSSEQARSEMGHGDAVELPAHRMSRVEAPEDGVGEMPGENWSKEMQAEDVALEMEAGGRRRDGDKT